MKLTDVVLVLIHIHQCFMWQNEHRHCKSGATYKHSGEIFNRGVQQGVQEIITMFMDANSSCTKTKLLFFHNTSVPNSVLQRAQILSRKKCV